MSTFLGMYNVPKLCIEPNFFRTKVIHCLGVSHPLTQEISSWNCGSAVQASDKPRFFGVFFISGIPKNVDNPIKNTLFQ